jgi:hypothetical protein
VQRTFTVFFQRQPVGLGGVSFIDVPSVRGELCVGSIHQRVSVGFGKNTGGRYTGKSGIPFDFAAVRQGGVGGKSVAVNEQLGGRWGQLGNGAVHGEVSRLQDVAFVDFGWGGLTDGPRSSG